MFSFKFTFKGYPRMSIHCVFQSPNSFLAFSITCIYSSSSNLANQVTFAFTTSVQRTVATTFSRNQCEFAAR